MTGLALARGTGGVGEPLVGVATKQLEATLQRARTAIKQGVPERAVEVLRPLRSPVIVDWSAVRIEHLLARALDAAGDDRAARDAADRAHAAAGRLAATLGDAMPAEERFGAIQLFLDATLHLADLSIGGGDPDRAVEVILPLRNHVTGWRAVQVAFVLGRAHDAAGRIAQAQAEMQRAHGIAATLYKASPPGERDWAAGQVVALRMTLSELLRRGGKPAAAEALLTEARGLQIEHAPQNAGRLADLDLRLGRAVLAQSQYERADRLFARAADGFEALGEAGASPAAAARTEQAKIALALGRLDRARDLAHGVWRSLAAGGQLHSEIALEAQIQLARIAIERLAYDEAEERLTWVVTALEATGRRAEPVYASAVYNLGEIAVMRGCYDDGDTLTEEALAAYLGFVGPDNGQIARIHHRLGIIRERRGDPEGALEAFGRALQIIGNAGDGERRREEMATLLETIRARGRLGQNANAIKIAQEAVTFFEQLDEPAQWDALAHAGLGRAYLDAGALENAEAEFRLAIRMLGEESGGDNEQMPPGLIGLAEIALAKDRGEEARRLARRADRILDATNASPMRRLEAQELLVEAGAPSQEAAAPRDCFSRLPERTRARPGSPQDRPRPERRSRSSDPSLPKLP